VKFNDNATGENINKTDKHIHSHKKRYLEVITTTYLERQKCYGSGKKILFKKQLFDKEVKVPQRSLRYVTNRLMVMHIRTRSNTSNKSNKTVH
jgi:hypothetical protein